MSGSRKVPGRSVNRRLTEQFGREVLNIDTMPLEAGQLIELRFESISSDWRQGVWLSTEGELVGLNLSGDPASKFIVWQDAVPEGVVIEIQCTRTEGLLHIYNIWNEGDRPLWRSLMAWSGMLVEELDDGSRHYRCNDTGEIDFDTLVFRISVRDTPT